MCSALDTFMKPLSESFEVGLEGFQLKTLLTLQINL